MAAGERVVLPQGSFADGVAVAQVGAHCFELCRHFVDEVLTVSTDELCAAIKDIYDDTRSITEPSGALAVAGIKQYVAQHGAQGQTRWRSILAPTSTSTVCAMWPSAPNWRAARGIIAVTIPEQPGSFRAFCQALGKRQITEFNRYYPGQQARLFVGVQTTRCTTRASNCWPAWLGSYAVQDLTDNELAVACAPHRGGHAAPGAAERVLRFEFPERPGALLGFLEAWASTGTSACSITATMARPRPGCSPPWKCRRKSWQPCRRRWMRLPVLG